MTPNRNHDALITAAEAGDCTAIQQLLLPYCASLARQIAAQLPARVKTVVGVEDVLQQTLIQAVQNFHQRMASDATSLHNWLHAIAKHRVQDAIRNHNRLKRGRGHHQVAGRGDQAGSRMESLLELLSNHGDSPSQEAAKREAAYAVQIGLATLPAAQREAIALRYFRGLNTDDAARELNRTPEALRGLVYRAKQSLRCLLGNSSCWFSQK